VEDEGEEAVEKYNLAIVLSDRFLAVI